MKLFIIIIYQNILSSDIKKFNWYQRIFEHFRHSSPHLPQAVSNIVGKHRKIGYIKFPSNYIFSQNRLKWSAMSCIHLKNKRYLTQISVLSRNYLIRRKIDLNNWFSWLCDYKANCSLLVLFRLNQKYFSL